MTLQKITQTLQKENRWVCWDKEKNKKGQPTKVPKNPKTGGNAMSNNPDTWSDFNTAIKRVSSSGFSGIGFMLGDGFVGVDIDHCRDSETADLSEMAKDVVRTLNSYTEITPSGTGIHIICTGDLPEGRRRNEQIEIYDKVRFFTVTGETVGELVEVQERSSELSLVHKKYFGTGKDNVNVSNNTLESTGSMLDDGELIDKALKAANGQRFEDLMYGAWEGKYPSQSEADLALCNMLAFWACKNTDQMDRIFRRSGLYRPKWDENRNDTTYGAVTINKAISSVVQVYTDSEQFHSDPAADFGLPTNPKRYSLDDTGNAKRLIDRHGADLRYSYVNSCWYIWNGRYWAEDLTGEIKRRVDQTVQGMHEEAKNIPDDTYYTALMKWTTKSRSAYVKASMIKEAKHLEGIPVLPHEMDNNEWLFNCQNGTVDLKTGALLPHRREDLITRMSTVEYQPGKQCELWITFLTRIMGGNTEMVEFLQRAVGYALTGSTGEQCCFITYGSGANGKSTFLETVRSLLGQYAKNVQPETIMIKDRGGSSSSGDIARLKGARYVTTVEPDEGKRLSEGVIKQLTGGDATTARFLYGGEFEFVPVFKLWLGTNHKPIIKGNDDGIWRRIRLIPFEVTIPVGERDKELSNKLRRELPGIFNWAIKGCLQWQQEGLKPPADVMKATDDYRTEMDVVEGFISECCKCKPGESTKAAELYKTYVMWCSQNGERELSQRRFGMKLKERRFKNKKLSGLIYWVDLILSESGRSLLLGGMPYISPQDI